MKTILSYKDWVNSLSTTSVAARAYPEYLKYVNTQYEIFKSTTASESSYALEYIQFIKDLQELLYQDEETTNFLKNLDYTDQVEINMSVPFFAKNLRKIAQYIGEHRKDPKNTAVKYTDIDSIQYLKNTVYSEIANKFIVDNATTNGNIFSELQNLNIDIKELYDDTKYFDKDPSNPASFYYDISANNAAYSSQTVVPSGLLEWVMYSGFNPISISSSDTTSPSGYIQYDSALSGDKNDIYYNYNGIVVNPQYTCGMSQAYLGETQYQINTSTGDIEAAIIPKNPTGNILNRYYPTVAMVPLMSGLYSVVELGGYTKPKSLGVSIYHGKNRELVSPKYRYERTVFPDSVVYSNGISLTKIYQDTPIYYHPTLNWMDIKYYIKTAQGIVGDSKTYQEMIPYKTEYEKTGKTEVGISRLLENVDPWTGATDTVWSDPKTYPPDFRKLYNTPAWEASLETLGGYEYSWGVDVYGNNYALYKNTKPNTEWGFKNVSDGEIFIRGIDGYIIGFSMLFYAKWDDSKYWPQYPYWPDVGNFADVDMQKLKEMQIYYDTMIVVGETGCAVVQNLAPGENGLPEIKSNNGHNFNYDVNLSVKDGYTHFDHFFDDRTKILYVASSKLIDGMVHIKLYEWSNISPKKILDTTTIASVDYILPEPITTYSSMNMDLNAERNQIIMSFVGTNETSNFITNVIYDLNRKVEVVDVIYIPYDVITPGSSITDEPRNIIDINFFDNKLLFVVEGSSTGNKYLQISDMDLAQEV